MLKRPLGRDRGRELRQALCAAWVGFAGCVGLAGLAGSAWAQPQPESQSLSQSTEGGGGLRTPARLTVGVGDQFLGQLAPPGSPLGNRLVFVSNRSIVTEIYAQDLEQGRERRLFDDGADVTWPRISPDGRRLLYISFRHEAGGQLCVRDLLPSSEPAGYEVGPRRCLDDATVALQAEWAGDRQILLLSRATIQGDLQLSRVQIEDGKGGAGQTTQAGQTGQMGQGGQGGQGGQAGSAGALRATPLPGRNLSSPTVSPDGRWLIYVPVRRSAQTVGPGFAARASARLEALRLDQADAQPLRLALDLPGLSGQPVFSPDGRWLYVTQFFTDSNADGVIDADDRGVLFRLPFDSGRDDAVEQAAAASPDQLTSQAWNCQYPAPSATSLVATCERGGSLDVYQLPLDGQVPATWDTQRLRAELGMAGRKADEILLYRQRMQLESRPRPRRLLLMRLARLHLGLEDYDAAAYYARRMGAVEDPATAGLEAPLLALIEHRHGLKLAEQGRVLGRRAAAGRMTEAQQQAALDVSAAPSPSSAALRHIVRSELAQAKGDFTQARSALEAATAILRGASVERAPRAVLEAWYERVDALYRLLGERELLVDAGHWLSQHPAFNEDDQLDYARMAVRALYRGRPYGEADALLAEAQAQAQPGSLWAYALELGRHINALREERVPRAQRDALLAFYRQQAGQPKAALRQRALVQDAVERAAELGADSVLELLALVYVEDTRAGTQEHRRAERLYSRALMGRAYRRLANQRLDAARADFDLVTQRTGSLEAAVESVSLRLRAGVAPEVIAQEVTTTVPGLAEPLSRFVRAYVITRQLGRIDDAEAHRKAVAAAQAELRAAWPVLKNRREAQALQGAIWHEDFLRSRDAASAERANRNYRVALDLVRDNLRYRAMLLGALGMLHTQAGNYAIALSYLDERDRLPYTDNAAGLAVSLARANALLHMGRDSEAAQAADAALAMTDAVPRLAERYGALAQDRAALYHLSAGHFERSLALYDRLLAAPAAGDAAVKATEAAGTAPADSAAATPADAPTGTTPTGTVRTPPPAPPPRNALVQRLARSAAALGADQPARALDDLIPLERELAQPSAQSAFPAPGSRATPPQALRTQRLIAAGLQAKAHMRLGQLDEAAHALERRRALYVAQFGETDRDEDLRALILAELQLAENAVDRKDAAQTAHWLGQALQHADALAKRTQAPVNAGQLNTLWFAAQWQAAGGDGSVLPFDLPARLAQARRVLAERPERDGVWRAWLAWFEAYQALHEPAAEGSGQSLY
jgi:Tol biopolymer transport system component